MRKIIFDNEEVVQFFKENGTVAITDDEMYVYMPFWFKVVDDNQMNFINWDRLPKELREYILNRRNSLI